MITLTSDLKAHIRWVQFGIFSVSECSVIWIQVICTEQFCLRHKDFNLYSAEIVEEYIKFKSFTNPTPAPNTRNRIYRSLVDIAYPSHISLLLLYHVNSRKYHAPRYEIFQSSGTSSCLGFNTF
jgi:hypothetical protein